MLEYRRHLPHIHPDAAYLFVTWCLSGVLPPRQPDMLDATPGHAFAAQDRALVRASGPRWLGDIRVAAMICEKLRAGEARTLYELYAWVVMPNHVHVLLLPLTKLSRITQWLKGTTARQANLLLERSGNSFWQHESYDHWVRDGGDFRSVVKYIENNPVSAGLVVRPEDWPFSSARASESMPYGYFYLFVLD